MAEEQLIHELRQAIYKLRADAYGEKHQRSSLKIPGELFIKVIHQRINFRTSRIALIRSDNTRILSRIQRIKGAVDELDLLRENATKNDVHFLHTRKIDYAETYNTLDRKYRLQKSSQYPLACVLQQSKYLLVEQDRLRHETEKKCQAVENHLRKLNDEIECIAQENDSIANENRFLRERMADVKRVPTITDYAYIIEQTKDLQHGIDLWTRRVRIAEVSSFVRGERIGAASPSARTYSLN